MEKTKGTIADKIDLVSILRDVLWQSWAIFLFAAGVYLITNVIMDRQYEPIYTTSSTFVVTTKDLNSSIYTDMGNALEVTKRFTTVLDSTLLKKKIAEDLGIDEFTATAKIRQVEETNLLVLTVTDRTAMMAYRTIQSIMENYSEVSDYVVQGVQLDVIQEPTIPGGPSNFSNARAVSRQFFKYALLAGIAYVAIFSFLKDTVKNPREAKNKLDARLLGTIYHEYRGISRIRTKRTSMRITNPILSFRYVESCRLTATKVRNYMDRRKAKVLMITAVMENEGKSTVAANIALSLAQEGSKVLLVDSDFRKPAIYKIFEIAKDEVNDLPAVLRTGEGIRNIITKLKDENLYFILNKKGTSRIESLLANGTLRGIIDFSRTQFDYVIVDTPPSGLLSDAATLSEWSDGAIYVVRQDFLNDASILDSVQRLSESDVRFIGSVINLADRSTSHSGYGYGGYGGYGYAYYGYGSKKYYTKGASGDEDEIPMIDLKLDADD